MKRRHLDRMRPLRRPQTQGGAVLDFLIVADDRLADAAEQAARRQAFLHRSHDVVGVVQVMDGEEQHGQIGRVGQLFADEGANVEQGGGGRRGGGQAGGEWHEETSRIERRVDEGQRTEKTTACFLSSVFCLCPLVTRSVRRSESFPAGGNIVCRTATACDASDGTWAASVSTSVASSFIAAWPSRSRASGFTSRLIVGQEAEQAVDALVRHALGAEGAEPETGHRGVELLRIRRSRVFTTTMPTASGTPSGLLRKTNGASGGKYGLWNRWCSSCSTVCTRRTLGAICKRMGRSSGFSGVNALLGRAAGVGSRRDPSRN